MQREQTEGTLPGLALKIPKKPPPLPLPPKSPKRYNSQSSSRSNATSPAPELPPPSTYSPISLPSTKASCSTSPVESYFDALSLAPSSPKAQQTALAPQAPWTPKHTSPPVTTQTPPPPPAFERRESAASSSCLSDEELATRAYVQRRTERRTSALPLPSPDAPHSQRRRHRRREASSNSGVASSQASISSAAGSLPASENEAPSADSRPGSAHTKDKTHLSPRLRSIGLDGQTLSTSPRSSSPLQKRTNTQHPSTYRDSQATTSTSTSSRTRTSQATSSGPFDLEETVPPHDQDSKHRHLRSDFFDSFGKAGIPQHLYSDGSSRLSMPVTAHSFDDTIDPLDVRPVSASQSLASEASSSASQDYERSSNRSSSPPRWSIPVVRDPPLSSPVMRHPSLPRSSSASSSAHSGNSVPLPSSVKEDGNTPMCSRRTSASTTTRKRVGRIYSTATVVSDSTVDELKTPRVSVSNQGRLADSIYSVAGTAPDTFPYTIDTSKDLPQPPTEEEGEPSIGLGLPLPSDSRRPSVDQYAIVEETEEEIFKHPAFSRFSMYTDSLASSANSPTDPSADQASLPSTPYSDPFRASVNSFSSSLNLIPPTPSIGMSDDEKMSQRRRRVIQELVQTEEDFARDMALVRDVWLARARGKEMGEIMATLENYASSSSRPISSASSTLGSNTEGAGIRIVERKSSAPQMQRNSSQNSFKALKGLVNNLSARPSEEKVHFPTGRQAGNRAASYSSTPRQRSTSNAQALPPGAALYAPLRQADTDIIFGNVEAVASFSSQLAALLAEAQSSEETEGGGGSRIGQTFLTMLPRLSSVYSTYCAHFGDAMQRWESLADSLASYDRDCKDMCYGHTNAWDLPSLLIKPVQRCLKYPLFIQSLLECTPDGHPDKTSLQLSNTAMLKVAENINEMKRRHEIVGKLIKRKARPGLYGSTRRGSDKAVQQAKKTPSGSSFTSSLSKKFKRCSRIGLPDASATATVPEPDEEFENLLIQLETKHRVIQSFILDTKSWSKSIRAAMVSLLQLSLAWKNLSSLSGQDNSNEAGQSSRTIDHFAVSVVRSTVEDQWRDMDQEIRKTLIPRAAQVLELFSSPRSAIATRYYRYNESRSKAAAKDHALLKEHATAYYALNAQLKEELPVFLGGVEKIFTAMVERFVSLQAAFNERMTESWREYIESCCTQLGPPGQKADDSVTQWWRLHSSLAQQLDSLSILAADKVIEDVQRRQRSSLPPSLRPRSETGKSASFTSPPRLSQRRSRQKSTDSSISFAQSSVGSSAPPLPRMSTNGQGNVDPLNRNSAFSSASAGSMSFSGQSSSSVTSPPTPASEYPTLWQGAVASSFRPSGQKTPLKGFNFSTCEPGDLFEVLDEPSGEKYLLVRPEGQGANAGWLPAHLLHRLE